MKIKNKKRLVMFGIVFCFISLLFTSSCIVHFMHLRNIPIENPYILILLEQHKLYYEDKFYLIGVGHRTPTGVGYISEKRDQIIFRYTKGPLDGKIITKYVDKNGRSKPMPYKKMRALAMVINNQYQFVIHSTTDDNSLGKSTSNGCIRLGIDDMLELYPKIEVNTRVIIRDD